MTQAVLLPATIPVSGLGFYRAGAVERIRLIKDGILASDAKTIIGYIPGSQNDALRALDISAATLNRKIKDRARLPPAETERLLGLARLLGQVQSMVEESGAAPETFDAPAWLSRWLGEPLPALGGIRPVDLLDTIEGQTLISTTLAQTQASAYA